MKGGARVSEFFFTKDPNLKKNLAGRGRGEVRGETGRGLV